MIGVTDNRPDLSKKYTGYPMTRIFTDSVSASTILSSIGGRWTAINMIVYLVGAFTLVDSMMTKQAKEIQSR